MTAVEDWKSIPDFEEYEASSEGRIRRRKTGYVLITQGNPCGYRMVGLYKGKNIQRTVHSLVCSAFHGARPHGKHCAHSDGNKANNKPSNLRWATKVENEADKRLHGRHHVGEARANAKLSERQVIEIRAAEGFQREIAERFGVNQQAVSMIKHGRRWSYLNTPVAGIDGCHQMRRRRGQESGNSKLTEIQVRAIREATGTLAEIGNRFGVAGATVWGIRNRRSWKHI